MKKNRYAIIIFIASYAHANVNDSEIINKIRAMGQGINHSYKSHLLNQTGGVFATVGADVSCDFNSIQDAINSTVSEVRIATNKVYTDKLTITDLDIIIRGGFANCSQAENNIQSSSRSVIDHTGLNSGAIIAISGFSIRNTIVLENLHLTGAATSGIETTLADAEVSLVNMRIDNNHITSGDGGGGISIISGDTDFMLVDSIISENSAEYGGGISCTGSSASLLISGESGVSQNMAIGLLPNNISGNGGGLYITDGCVVRVYSGTKNINVQTLLGISGNQSTGDGGGIYVSQGASVILSGHRSNPNGGIDFFGDNNKPVNLNNNSSDLNNTGSGGGGAFVTGMGSFLFITGGLIKDNVSTKGGGVFTQNEAILYVTRLEQQCWDSVRCNFFQNNIARLNGKGGAIYNLSSRLLITNSYFEDNQAGLGTAIYVKNGSTDDNRIDVSVFNHNSKLANGLDDKHVISLEASGMDIKHSTFADNNVAEAVIGVDANSFLRLVTSIVHETSGLVASQAASNSIVAGCNMVHDITNIPISVVDDPEFVDRNNRDYHLNPNLSPAIDICTDFAVSVFRDIDFNQRHWDYPNIDNDSTFGGPMSFSDAGADEVFIELIFANGFE